MPHMKHGKPVKRRIIQIACGDVYDSVDHPYGDETTQKPRNTLFVLTDDGEIWTRSYDNGHYQEWFKIAQDIETQ